VAAPPDQATLSLTAPDGASLGYRLFPAAGEAAGALVYLHGIQSHGGWYLETADELSRNGYSVYLADRRGSGGSSEPPGYFRNRAQLVDDVAAFVELARREHQALPVFLVGGCWGARPAVTFALQSQDELTGLVLISPALAVNVDLTPAEKLKVVAGGLLRPRSSKVRIPLSPELFTRNERWLEFIRTDPLALTQVSTSFFLRQAAWDRYLKKQTGLRLPLLLLQSGRDEIVDVPAVRTWFDRQASPSKRYIVYPEFDHLLDFEDERARYWSDLVGWLDEVAAVRAPTGERERAPA
jgi:acylglycerol lipase